MQPLEGYGWNWSKFKGSREGLRWNRRDLADSLERSIALTPCSDVAIQAGGNLGIFPKRLAQTFKAVYTFEPDAICFEALVHNAPEENIIKMQAALGASPSFVSMSRERRDGKPNLHEGITHVAGKGIIPTIKIDDLGFKVCDLIALDLEGWELYALAGATETILRCRPTLVVEINKSLGFVGISEEEVRSLISELGYIFVEKNHSDEIFIPKERK